MYTVKDFVYKAKQVHSNKYNYSNINFVNLNTKITITCPVHGDFEQTPAAHLTGKGCRKCGIFSRGLKKKLTTEKFIIKATQVHGNKYDYSKVVYVSAHTKVIIICHEHGEFLQTPANHLYGKNCYKCGRVVTGLNKRTLIDDFLKKAKQVHGCKYDYSKVDYINTNTKITITCPVHGDFEQIPANHLFGANCSKCSKVHRPTTEEFINRAIQVHGNKYDYSKVVYTTTVEKIKIICKIHGVFEQTPNGHLSGRGCVKCSGKYTPTTEEFINRAIQVHGNKYDYSKVIYLEAYDKITIICNKHGEFRQTPSAHLNKKAGCPGCNESKGEKIISSILEKNNIICKREYKIKELVEKYNKHFEYDFYLPEYNLLIEFHGIQHYEYIPYFHKKGKQDLLKQKKRDREKKLHALYWGYGYLEISYISLKKINIGELEKRLLLNIKRKARIL